ncbi:MAG: extracellular solute-binding protein [Pseudomonadota bacterium]
MFGLVALGWLTAGALAEEVAPRHGLAMHGAPMLPADFAHLPYADPDAPKGGTIVLSEVGGFDSLNPYVLRGTAPWGMRLHVFESLLARNWDEPFGLYGLLAESVETAPDRRWVEFTLREEARFADGAPVTVEDVLWSMETLAADGVPSFRITRDKVARAVQTGPRSVRFELAEPDRELALILGLRPILQKAAWEGVSFRDSGLFVPTGSGPYRVASFEPNGNIVFARRPDYWGAGLGVNVGRHNFDTIRYEFFADSGTAFEAFKAGLVSVYREGDPVRWARQYDFPAVANGEIVRAAIPHGRPSGMRGFVFNTRRAPFDDIRVRQALLHAFNFTWINARLNDGVFPRITSYFANSDFAFDGAASPGEEALLAPFAAGLPPDTLSGPTLPAGSDDLRNRRGLRTARQLLAEAGWEIADGQLRNAAGAPFAFEILLRSQANEAVASIYADALARLGIDVDIRVVDDAQYETERNAYDFDMIVNLWALSLSPGNEQRFYWGSDGVTEPGTRNYPGIDNPAVDAMIDALLAAETPEDFRTAVRALDRVLMAGRYVIPFWYAEESWLAHDVRVTFPEALPLYGDWTGFLPDVWWWDGEAD